MKKLIIYNSLTHLLPMHPFSTPRKLQKTARFPDVFREERKGASGRALLLKK